MWAAHGTRRRLGWLLGAGVLGGLAALWLLDWPMPWSAPVPPAASEAPLPPYSTSPFLNTAPGVAYIGSDACATCHAQQHRSYLHTAHSRALSDLDPSAEPPDGAFRHVLSDRSYRVYRADGKLRHEEVMRTGDGKEIARVDHPIRYLIGSGHFCRSYLVEVDGFLHESPITWYTSKKKWDMSPGYDFQRHWGFERPIRIGCLLCHAGRVEPVSGTVHRMTFTEKAIGCENCHGPGALHQALHAAQKQAPGTDDKTIVHPGRLPRDLQEAVCASCHLSAAASVLLRGRAEGDFRPGRPLSDFRIDYGLTGRDAKMTVVGHVEQLRLSACYQKSNDLTCLTCHDPHRREPPQDLIAHHRQQCLNCHAEKGCSVAVAERRQKNAADDCVACHMPRGDTEIPHIAFTHHRIGRHGPAPAPAANVALELAPLGDLSHLSLADRRRNLGLAYMELARDPAHARHAATFRARGRQELEAACEAGLRDGAVAQALAELDRRDDPANAAVNAQAALDAKDTPAAARAIAQLIRADAEFVQRNYGPVIELLEDLTRQRRFAEDWRLLGVSYLEQGRTQKALATLEKALAIRPYRHTTHLGLAEAYRRLGDDARAREHLDKAQWLLWRGHD